MPPQTVILRKGSKTQYPSRQCTTRLLTEAATSLLLLSTGVGNLPVLVGLEPIRLIDPVRATRHDRRLPLRRVLRALLRDRAVMVRDSFSVAFLALRN